MIAAAVFVFTSLALILVYVQGLAYQRRLIRPVPPGHGRHVTATAEQEKELTVPLAAMVAEAERKAIAAHSPLPEDTYRVTQPPTRHPFDPCYLPDCGEARSRHEHVETIGAGVNSVNGVSRSYRTASEAAAAIVTPEPIRKLRERREVLKANVWAFTERLDHHPRFLTDADMAQWKMLHTELEVVTRRLAGLETAWDKVR